MEIKDISFTSSDFRAAGINSLLASMPDSECDDIAKILMAEAQDDASEKGPKETVLAFFATLASLHFAPHDPKAPFKPSFVMGGRRGLIPEDVPDPILTVLAEICQEIEHPDLRARVADILWLQFKSGRHQYAKIAIAAYLVMSERLWGGEEWFSPFERVERAFRIAKLLGRGNPTIDEVLEFVERWLRTPAAERASRLCSRLVGLLREADREKAGTYLAKVESVAEAYRRQQNFLDEADYRQLATSLIPESEREKRTHAVGLHAEAFFNHARLHEAKGRGGYMIAAGNVERGIEVMRQARLPKAEIDVKLLWMQDLQKMGMGEMATISVPGLDLTDEALKVIDAVKGLTFDEAFLKLALISRIPDVKSLRSQAEKHSREFLFRSIAPTSAVDGDGKRIAWDGDINSADSNERERAWSNRMHELAGFNHQVNVRAAIEPARETITSEHAPRLEELLPILSGNPFVPAGREISFGKGLLAGFYGEFLEAVHLLVPQLENCLRHVLKMNGVVTTSLNNEGIQEELDLNRLLSMPQLEHIFGPDLIFDLRGLLVERFGSNLRNKLAHGLLQDDQFETVEARYLWWSVLRMVCIPRIIAFLRAKNDTRVSDSKPAVPGIGADETG